MSINVEAKVHVILQRQTLYHALRQQALERGLPANYILDDENKLVVESYDPRNGEYFYDTPHSRIPEEKLKGIKQTLELLRDVEKLLQLK